MATDDLQLIKQAQSGDAVAFQRLIELYYDTVYRFAYRWTANQANAEDIAQLSCIKLAKSLKQFRFESAFSSWLYRLVINCAKDWEKSQKRHHGEAQNDQLTENASNTNQLENEVQLQQTLEFLTKLGEGMQETAILVFAEGLSHKETADTLGVKESTISWRIHEMRKRLQSDHSAVEG